MLEVSEVTALFDYAAGEPAAGDKDLSNVKRAVIP